MLYLSFEVLLQIAQHQLCFLKYELVPSQESSEVTEEGWASTDVHTTRSRVAPRAVPGLICQIRFSKFSLGNEASFLWNDVVRVTRVGRISHPVARGDGFHFSVLARMLTRLRARKNFTGVSISMLMLPLTLANCLVTRASF